MADIKVKPRNGGFDVIHDGIAVHVADKRIARVVKLLIRENLYDAHWVATVLNRYGDRVPHLGDQKKGKNP
jgi:hypothetical protein